MVALPLKTRIKLILENSAVDKTDNYKMVVDNLSKYLNRTNSTKIEIEDFPEDFKFVNKQVLILKQLYLTLSLKDKQELKDVLLDYLTDNSVLLSRTALNSLIHIGCFKEALVTIKKEYKSFENEQILGSLILLTTILTHEWKIFAMEDVESLYEWTDEMISGKNLIGAKRTKEPVLYVDHLPVWQKLLRQTNQILVKDISTHLEGGIDLDIDLDEATLINEFKRFSFSSDLEEVLTKIDQKFSISTDEFDYKNCMDLLRSFTERLYEQIAKVIPVSNIDQFNPNDSKKVAKDFRDAGCLSLDQAEILTSIRHFLSNEGSHRLKSLREDARLSRNLTIEFSLYLMKKLETNQTS